MNTIRPRAIEVDWAGFDPWRIQALRHTLSEHPLLQADQLVTLGERLDAKGRVRTHSNDATAGTPFNDAPKLHPNNRSTTDTLRSIGDANAWMSLLNVQSDEVYRGLVDEVLNDIKPDVDRVDPGMCYRGGWIFISSPNTVVPFHIDKEHNFILQMRGKKRVYVWDHRDTVAVSEMARDRFHYHHARDLIQWREELRARAQVFDLEPGMGAYMPSTSPHMVENGDEASITMSFTYYTKATRRDATLHKMHDLMRRRGFAPPAVGQRPLLDGLTYAGASLLVGARRMARRLAGKPVHPDSAPYAAANVF